MGSLVAKLLLPTISTLVFLPTISIAAKRRFHMEAMVYFFTMFFVAVRCPHTSPACFVPLYQVSAGKDSWIPPNSHEHDPQNIHFQVFSLHVQC